MAMRAENVRRQALELTDNERAELAAELLVSLEEQPQSDDAEHSEAWTAELERRARSVVSGQTHTIAWQSARQVIVDELTG
jgi:putative addiction module component (TIGR02574 family)